MAFTYFTSVTSRVPPNNSFKPNPLRRFVKMCRGSIDILTFNPGWDQSASPLASFTDVRDVQKSLDAQGVNITTRADPDSTGPEPRHFVMPFLAHALGTLVGALAAYLIAARHKAPMAYVVGAFFLCGGVAASFMIPAPAWFIALDVLVAYLPMAWLATRIGARMQSGKAAATRGA